MPTPLAVNVVVVDVPNEANVPPELPGARQMSYPVTRTLSVDAAQLNVTTPQPVVAVGVPGTVGAWASTGGGVDGGGLVGHGGGSALTGAVKADVLPAASRART